MNERWIVDASPLIALGAVGRANLLLELTGELLVPGAVAEEVSQGPPEDSARRLLERGFGTSATPAHVSGRLLAWGLGRGETEVLALASEISDARVVLDDAAARRCARTFGIPMIGTLGVVVRAKQLGRIESAAVVFRSLRDRDFRVDDGVMKAVLEKVGESW